MVNNIFIIVVTVTLSVYMGIAYVIQTRMKSEKREYFVLFLFSVFIYQLGYFFEMTASTADGGFIATKLMYTGTAFIMPLYLMFIQKYCEIKLKNAANIFIFILAVLIILLVWTSDRHTLYYLSYRHENTDGINRLAVTGGPLYPLGFLNAILCAAISIVILIKKMFSHSDSNTSGKRWKYGLLIFGAVAPLGITFLYALKLNFYGVDIAPVLLAATIISLYLSAFKHDLMENEDTVRTQNWLREMVGHISHEMKTPLTIIATDIQLAEQLINDGKLNDAKELMREAWQETMQTANLVTDTLSFSRGQNALKPMENFNSGAIIETTLAIFEPSLKKHGNTLVRDIAKPAKMYGNADMLSVAIVNLLLNANRYTNGGVIKVEWVIEDGQYRLTVRDNGSGIPPEILPRVFERGVSGGNSTGLGLSIVKRVTELHGGKVNIESETGKGTAVTLIFPMRMDMEEQKQK